MLSSLLLLLLLFWKTPAMHCQQLLDGGVLKPIMRVMAVHEGVPTVEQYGCWILENLSLDSVGQNMIAQSGGPALFQRLVHTYQAEADSCSRVGVCVSVCLCE